nr:hypothetical protein [Tanacetum cinerariifolium]
ESHIYISCIKQFWNSVSVKRSGDVTRLQALVDKKKVVISEAVIHEILQLNDAEGVVDAAVTAAVIEDVVDDVDENVAHVATLSPPPHDCPSPSQEPSSPPQQQQTSPQAPPQDAEFLTQFQQVLNVCSALSKHVENLETDNAAQKLEIV